MGVDYLVDNAGRSTRRSFEPMHERFHHLVMAASFSRPVRLTMPDRSGCCRRCARSASATTSTSSPWTSMRVALVVTAMTGPTDAYGGRRAESPQHCAERLVRTLEDRPITVNGVIGSTAEVLNLMVSRLRLPCRGALPADA